ncbi:MAG: flagellar biosynthesis protein FlaG [Nitrospira sp. CR2.1]|nr:flagellar biosynthesis protein FlaG [Nitrospira sp. CR2.1]
MLPEVSNVKDLPAAVHTSHNAPQPAADKKVVVRKPEPEPEPEPAKAEGKTEGKAEVKELEQALSRVREVFQKADSRLEFTIDPDLDRVVVKVMDGDSGTVIRQIPQQEVIDLAKRLETPTGLLLHHKV